MKSQSLCLVLAIIGNFALNSQVSAEANHDEKKLTKPNLKEPEKPSEKEQRVVPKPGAAESQQPPPDVVLPEALQSGKEQKKAPDAVR